MSLNKQKYHSFAILLEELRSELTNISLNALELRQRTTSLQQFFQQQIVPIDNEDTDSQDWGRVQSYRTEMSKQLRLLEIDVMFFQGSRQASTAQQRLDTINHRLTTLIEYSRAILQTEE